MQFSLLSTSRLATPSVFSLSFNVFEGPPTIIECTLNGVYIYIFSKLSRVIVNGTESITRVTVTNLTEAGNYQCIISNARVTAGTLYGFTAGTFYSVTANSSTSSLSVSG